MSRIFRRPMFRKGGNVGDGIMTGIVDRENHSVSDPLGVGGQSYRERIMEAYDKYPAQDFDPLTQFLLQYGPELATAKPEGGIIGTAVGAAKGPLKNLITNIGAENRAKRKIAMEGEILDIEGDIKKDVAQIQQRGALDIKKEYPEYFNRKTIAIHFRIGNYYNLQNMHPIKPVQYYLNALKELANKDVMLQDYNILLFCQEVDNNFVNEYIKIINQHYPNMNYKKVADNIPDWKVQTNEWNVEDTGQWKTEDTDKFFYEIEEKKND